MKFRLVKQEHTAGCAIACVASILNMSYKKALVFFNKKYLSRRGYYCDEIVKILNKNGLNYKYSKVNDKTKIFLSKNGSIVFIKRSKEYPIGHYLLKTSNGWMNPWINYPSISPAKAGLQKKLPGNSQWIIFSS